MKEAIQGIREKVEENVLKNGLNSNETMKWSLLLNRLINIYEKIKKYNLQI